MKSSATGRLHTGHATFAVGAGGGSGLSNARTSGGVARAFVSVACDGCDA